MTRCEINAVVRSVCESEFRCPIHKAGADCDCNSGKGKCPFRDALELAAEEERTDIRNRIEAAHGREVADVLKDRDEMFKSEQETVAKTKEWFDEYQKLKREVSELRELSNDMRTWFRLYYSCGSDSKSKWWRSCATCRRKSCPANKRRKELQNTADKDTVAKLHECLLILKTKNKGEKHK